MKLSLLKFKITSLEGVERVNVFTKTERQYKPKVIIAERSFMNSTL